MGRTSTVVTAWFLNCLHDPGGNLLACSLWTIGGFAVFLALLFGVYVLFVKLGNIWRVLGVVFAAFFLVVAALLMFG